MKYTNTFFDGFQDKEHRLIHLLEDGNPPLPAVEGDGPEKKESADTKGTERLDANSAPEDVEAVGNTALADAEKGSTELQKEVKKAQDDVNNIRLAAALGSGGLTAEEEHSAAEERLAQVQTEALMADHNPMSGTSLEGTHEQKQDGINEAEALVVDVNEKTDHVEKKEKPSPYVEKMKSAVTKLQEMLAYMKQHQVGEEDATVYTMMNGINNDLVDAGETPDGAPSKTEIINNQPNRLVAINDQKSILVQYVAGQDALTFTRIESTKPGQPLEVNIANKVDTESPAPGRGGGEDGTGSGTPETPKGDDLEGDGSDPNFHYGPPSMEPKADAGTSPEQTKDEQAKETPLTAESVQDQFKDAIKLMGSQDAAERNKGLGMFIEAIMKYIELKITGGSKEKPGEGQSEVAASPSESAPSSTDQKETPESNEQRDVLHGPARRARLINAYRAEQQKQPGITATEFIAIKEDGIQKDEKSLTEEKDDLSKEEKNLKERLDILKSKREKADPTARGSLDAEIAETEQELKGVEKKTLDNKDALDKLENRKNDIAVLKELRDGIAEFKKQLDALPKETLENLSKEQRDVLEAFIEGTDAETYSIGFPNDEQIEKLPKNVQKIMEGSSFYRQKDVYRSIITPSPMDSKATTLPNPIELPDSAKKALGK